MSEPKDNPSFFRKVVRFVANPATDWADLNSRQDEIRETELEKSELKAMIERKRRNDFVRKREFDMLRKVRREGLSPEQLAALGTASQSYDSDARMVESGAKQDAEVKAKIDAIEQQMVGDNYAASQGRRAAVGNPGPAGNADTPTRPAGLAPQHQPAPPRRPPPAAEAMPTTSPGGLKLLPRDADIPTLTNATTPPPASLNLAAPDFTSAFAVEVSDVVHDPELDEAVIAFANADFEQCEQSLSGLTARGGARAQHAETWLVRFDLYRAIGEQYKFESLALDYAQQFGWSAPQWFSLPKLVAEAVGEVSAIRARVSGDIGWVCPEIIDVDCVTKLRSQSLQMPLPWVFDFGSLRSIDAEACTRMAELMRHWASQALEMRWLSGERFFGVLADATPTGVRDVDPAFWELRLDALRLANRPDHFDEAAIDYCVTYEVSPPSWERPKAKVRVSGAVMSTQSPPLSVVSEVSTSFVESTSSLHDEPANMVQVATVELSGQLVGDIGSMLTQLEGQLGNAPIVNVSCAKLIRVDFIAAGDLLNWVLKRRTENRVVNFVEAQRLVALFFGAMGINEHAKVKVRVV